MVGRKGWLDRGREGDKERKRGRGKEGSERGEREGGRRMRCREEGREGGQEEGMEPEVLASPTRRAIYKQPYVKYGYKKSVSNLFIAQQVRV